jgi:hypothetical protein
MQQNSSLPYEITLITNNLPSGITEIYNCWRRSFQPFKTWKPALYIDFLHKDIKVKTIFLPIKNTIIYLRLT